MPDEETPTDELQEEVTTEEVVPTEEELQAEDVARGRWAEACPDLAEQYDDISPAAREAILAHRAKRSTAEPTGKPAKDEASAGDSSTAGADSEEPSIQKPPTLDMDGLEADVETALAENDPAPIVKAFKAQARYLRGVARLMLDTLKAHDGRLDGFAEDMALPLKLKQGMEQVPGATEADRAVAEELLTSGVVTDTAAAFELAVARRQQQGKKGRIASEESRRRAAGIAASRGGGQPRAGGALTQRIPSNAAEYSRMLAEFEEQDGQGK